MAKHEYERDIICPYCDHKFSDSWEYNEDDEEVECVSCDKAFWLVVDVEVTYSTSRINCDRLEPPEEHDYDDPLVSKVGQDTCDRWNAERFCDRTDHVPYTMTSRTCRKCDHEELKKSAYED
jgi:hypothetical protein